MNMRSRRDFLAHMAAASFITQIPGLTFAAASGDARLVLILLRGALDGLSAAPPYADPDYANARGELAIAAPGASDGALRLDTTFGLHPSLSHLHARFLARELILMHAVASPYRERSHFDGQNVLENGTARAGGAQSGWLNRALEHLPAEATARESGLALGQNVPLVLRGEAPVASWAPSLLPEVDTDLLQRLSALYASDPMLGARLNDAVAIDALADEEGPAPGGKLRPSTGAIQRFRLMAEMTGKLLSAADGPRVAVLDAGGWDTHAQQGNANGQLAARLQGLDSVAQALAQGLKPVWPRTAILIVTEFGRTVARNGSRGTDHGTASCAFLLGGAVNGGRVIAHWPGLAARARFDGRDLAPTLDLRSVFKSVLHDHLHVPSRALEQDVFPDARAAPALADLVNA
jgi:uncharacterized protein (DUF1501 family)